jgi:hypothetical protein
LGFFLLAIPWFVGAVIFLLMICYKADLPGKYGFLACFIGVSLPINFFFHNLLEINKQEKYYKIVP